MCEMACQLVQKKQEEKQIEEEQAAKAQTWKLPVCYDDDDDEEGYNSLNDNIISELPPYYAVTPSEPVDSLSIGDAHLNTISTTESDEFIKSCVENLVPNPSESEGENECIQALYFEHYHGFQFIYRRGYDTQKTVSSVNNVLVSLVGKALILVIIVHQKFQLSLTQNLAKIKPFPQTLPSFHPTCYSGDESPFTCNSNPNIVDDSPNVFNPPPQPPKYSYEFCGNDAYYGYDCPPQQKNEEEEKQIAEEQAAKARYWKIPIFYDDDEDYTIAITPKEPDNSLSMGDEHLDTISAMKSDEFIKSSVENLVPNPSESEGKHECDVPACDDFTTFSNILFDTDDDFSSSDDELFSDEDISKKIYSNPLFDEEIISMKIDPHHFNAESDLIESMLNQDSSTISSSLKIDYLLDEFAGELILLKSIPPGIDETNNDPKEEIRLVERLFDPFIEDIDLFLTSDGSIAPIIDNDYSESEGDNLFLERLLQDDPIPLSDILDFSNAV
nr:hypothetical protein [Tanacetum cinerariifolium]